MLTLVGHGRFLEALERGKPAMDRWVEISFDCLVIREMSFRVVSQNGSEGSV